MNSKIYFTALVLLAAFSASAQNATAPAASAPAMPDMFNGTTSPAPVATPAPSAPATTTTPPAPYVPASSTTVAPDAAVNTQRDTLGVSDVKILPALYATAQSSGTATALDRLAQSLDSQLIASLGATRKFQILARSDLDVILKEQSLSNSGSVDDASATKMFKLAGAKYLLTVTIDDYQDRTETATFAAVGGSAQRRKISLSCVAKIYTSQTGKLVESAKLQIDDSDVRNNPAYIADTGANWSEKLPTNLANMAAEKIAQRVTDILYPAKVVAKTGTQITLNRGEGTGIATGQVWTVYATGKAMIDPDTGENLGFEEVAVGKARITTVTPRTAIAELTEDRGVTTLNTARQE